MEPMLDHMRKVRQTETHWWPYSESDWAESEAIARGLQAYLFD